MRKPPRMVKARSSRESQLVRSPRKKRQAFSGWPRWRVAEMRPMVKRAKAVRLKAREGERNCEPRKRPTAACVKVSMMTKGQ